MMPHLAYLVDVAWAFTPQHLSQLVVCEFTLDPNEIGFREFTTNHDVFLADGRGITW
jgi:hypothetical protein